MLPNIVETYKNFDPPKRFRRTIEILIKYVPPQYLIGLETIMMTNRDALPRDMRTQRVWGRSRKHRLTDARGAYSYASAGSGAIIWLFVDNICRTDVSWWRSAPVLRFMVPSDVLYHEIGHHIDSHRKRDPQAREEVAVDWSRKLWIHFFRKRYWYLYPVLSPFIRLISRTDP